MVLTIYIRIAETDYPLKLICMRSAIGNLSTHLDPLSKMEKKETYLPLFVTRDTCEGWNPWRPTKEQFELLGTKIFRRVLLAPH